MGTGLSQELVELLVKAIPESVEQFFRAEDIKKMKTDPSDNVLEIPFGKWVSTRIEFGGDAISGYLEMVVDENFGKETWPMEKAGFEKDENFAWQGDGGKDLVADWIGEISNRVLARIGRHLSEHNVEITLDAPVVVEPPSFGRACPIGDTRLQIPFQTKFGRVHAFLQIHAVKDNIVPIKNDEEIPDSGDIVEFG